VKDHAYHKKTFASIGIIAVFIFMMLLQETRITRPLYAQEMTFLSFGNGPIKVRLYADYFCGPCRSLEPKLENVISDLVKRNVINITFVDTPFHTYSPLYVRYFLYILNERKDLKHALFARNMLFEAARSKVIEKEGLEEYLHKKGIKIKHFDLKPTFNILQGYLKEDKINSTPTLVIYRGNKKETFNGADEILKAFGSLR
jgi:thiol-disulfide isomerase/thioredoxin